MSIAILQQLVATVLGSSSTTTSTGISATHRYHPTEYKHYAYLANGWSRPVRWNGIENTTYQVGIEPPSQSFNSWQPTPDQGTVGDVGLGVHLVRYRYKDSSTGYVSNPSEEREVVVATSAKTLKFYIGSAGGSNTNIRRSDDGKVDKIVIEMTTAGGVDFYVAAEIENVPGKTSTDLDGIVNISDAALASSFLPWPDLGHEPPPITKYLHAHKRRLWAFGQVGHSTGTINITSGNNYAVGTLTEWNETVLGSSSVPSDVKWFLKVDGDSEEYEISRYDSSTSRIYFTTNYSGTTDSSATYKIGTRANVIWVSTAGFPEGFTPLKYMETPQGLFSGSLTGGIGYNNSMVFFTQHSMFKLGWDQDPLVDPFMTNISTKHGALSQRVIVEVEGRIYAMDQQGIHVWSGGFPELISKPIESLFENMNFALKENFHASYFPRLRAIRWFTCNAGDSSNFSSNYIQFDIDTGNWSTGQYYQGISESRLVPWVDGTTRVLYGDENGHTWVADYGDSDGVSSTYSHLTVGPSSTTTTIRPTVSLPNSNVGLSGVFVHWVEGNETREIKASNDILFTMMPGFSTTPSDGDTIWVGPIPSKLKSKAFTARRSSRKKKSKYLTLQFQPTTRAGTLQVRTYEDYSSTKKQWRSGGNNIDGVTWPATAGSDWVVDTSFSAGVVDIPIGSEFRRTFEIEIEIIEPDVPLEILSIEHDGEELRDQT